MLSEASYKINHSENKKALHLSLLLNKRFTLEIPHQQVIEFKGNLKFKNRLTKITLEASISFSFQTYLR